MKRSALFALVFLISASAVFAESKATVKVNNDISGSSNSTVKSNTNIRVETNGEVTTYSSDEPGNIEVNSVNGVSEIKVNGQVVSQSPIQTNATKTPTPTDEPEEDDENNKEKARGIIDQIEDLLKKLFSLFS